MSGSTALNQREDGIKWRGSGDGPARSGPWFRPGTDGTPGPGSAGPPEALELGQSSVVVRVSAPSESSGGQGWCRDSRVFSMQLPLRLGVPRQDRLALQVELSKPTAARHTPVTWSRRGILAATLGSMLAGSPEGAFPPEILEPPSNCSRPCVKGCAICEVTQLKLTVTANAGERPREGTFPHEERYAGSLVRRPRPIHYPNTTAPRTLKDHTFVYFWPECLEE